VNLIERVIEIEVEISHYAAADGNGQACNVDEYEQPVLIQISEEDEQMIF